MRITGGELNGRVLKTPGGWNIRPTSSKVRQAVFNIIGNDISGFCVIDVFAGTGIMGIEALSRGSESVLFIDNSNKSLSLIKKNLELCGLSNRGHVIKKDLTQGMPVHCLLKQRSVDLAFIDPPYRKNIIPGVLESIAESKIMADGSFIIAESLKLDPVPEKVKEFYLAKTKIYGETKIDIYYRES